LKTFDSETFDREGADRLLHFAATGEIRDEDWDYFLAEQL
jgi:hypothetical protein